MRTRWTARLIAAAPDLLEALVALTGRANECCELQTKEERDSFDRLIENARAAIMKAIGEQT